MTGTNSKSTVASYFWAAWARVKPSLPILLTEGRFNFITIHYLYISGMTLLGSVIVFGIGGMPYIDALFFASGSATQSGLNTIDLNQIRTAQQIILYLIAMLCNPIIIHSSVVFVRLYWFEKRFKHVVEEARSLRRSKSKSRVLSKARDDPELGKIQRSVRGRSIVVLRDGRSLEESLDEDKSKSNTAADSVSSSSPGQNSVSSSDDTNPSNVPIQRRGAVEEDDMVPIEVRSPLHRNINHHISFLENQRSPKDTETLRIPSPREFDRGGRPQDVNDEEFAALKRNNTDQLETPCFGTVNFGRSPTANRITINEPDISRSRDKAHQFTEANSDQTGSVTSSAQPSPSFLSRMRSRRGPNIKELIRANTSFLKSQEDKVKEAAPYLSWVPTVVRNSAFVNLNEQQREELGGIEYRALKTLAAVLMGYYFSLHLLGIICLVPWILRTPTYGSIVTEVSQGRPWWAVFTAASAFNDLGFTLTPDSMISFGSAIFPLLLMTFLIIAGNTGFPCLLRFVIWFGSKLSEKGSGIWEEFQFLLDHPRRCFTLLFPRAATWWLFAILVVLNAVDLIFFVILDLHSEAVASLPGHLKFIDGLFQAASTRTAGFAVVNIANLHAAVQVSYMIMMYISVLPIAISMRRTNVYEERSLGIYGNSETQGNDNSEPSYVGAHLRKQLSFDLWYVFLGLFLIAIVEGDRIENTNDYAFTLFSVLFEIISAYGTVGLSLGYPTINASFSGEFRVISKLIIIAMQIRGRHRGLPYELDRAVLLPSESLQEKEAAEGKRMLARRRTSFSNMSSDEPSQLKSAPTIFNPLPLQDESTHPTAPTTSTSTSKSNSDLGADMHKSESKSSASVKSGLGNSMFKLAAPLHKPFSHGAGDGTKRD